MQVTHAEHFERLSASLDLTAHIAKLQEFFSRQKPLFIEGDQNRHFTFIQALQKTQFGAPPKIESFHTTILHLKKRGVLRFTEIFEIVKLVRYLRYFGTLETSGIVKAWIEKIEIPEAFWEIECHFDHKGSFDEGRDERLYGLSQRIISHKNEINAALKRLVYSKKLVSFLVDMQIHYLHEEECLLLRGGFHRVLSGSIVGRSSAGHFYVAPDAVLKEKQAIRAVDQEREALLYEYAKEFSQKMGEHLPFLRFIDKEFDRFDHYQSRVHFAKSFDFEFMLANKGNDLVVKDFCHPAIEHPKSVSVDFTQNILMVTGVNAGGKTMLLKSLLSCALMAKYLIPMRIDPHKSSIGGFKYIQAVIDDPQNVKNDISTFAGRMTEFSKLFEHKDALIGVDEIELGTDSDEAAALFSVLLDALIQRGQKIIVTTHHKRLASLMADRSDVTLLAAVYDEERRTPTYEFLNGIIGKSYAFETALRYGIVPAVVKKAKEVYGAQHEKLSALIERGSALERELKEKHAKADAKLETLEKKEQHLKELEENLYTELQKQKQKLQAQFDTAIDEAKRALHSKDEAQMHRAMNKAYKALPKEPLAQKKELHRFHVGENVKYRGKRGSVLSIKAKEAMVEVEGLRLRVKLSELKPSGNMAAPKKQKSDFALHVEQKSGLKCDLHGMRSDEAIETLDKFLSDALIAGWDEVIVYHGIGEGKLAYAVKNFLKTHPKVLSFEDAPPQMGGYGAKIVRL